MRRRSRSSGGRRRSETSAAPPPAIAEGYGRGAIILTTNRAFGEWQELFDNPVLASAALDRLAHGATQIIITGDSYRSKGPRSKAKALEASRA